MCGQVDKVFFEEGDGLGAGEAEFIAVEELARFFAERAQGMGILDTRANPVQVGNRSGHPSRKPWCFSPGMVVMVTRLSILVTQL